MPDGSEQTPQGRRTLENIMGALDAGKAKAADEAGRRRWLREQFAGAALTGLMAGAFSTPGSFESFRQFGEKKDLLPKQLAAKLAVAYADALLEELDRPGGQP